MRTCHNSISTNQNWVLMCLQSAVCYQVTYQYVKKWHTSPAGIRALDTVLGHDSPKCPKSSEALLPPKENTKPSFHFARIAFWYRALPIFGSIDYSTFDDEQGRRRLSKDGEKENRRELFIWEGAPFRRGRVLNEITSRSSFCHSPAIKKWPQKVIFKISTCYSNVTRRVGVPVTPQLTPEFRNISSFGF